MGIISRTLKHANAKLYFILPSSLKLLKYNLMLVIQNLKPALFLNFFINWLLVYLHTLELSKKRNNNNLSKLGVHTENFDIS